MPQPPIQPHLRAKGMRSMSLFGGDSGFEEEQRRFVQERLTTATGVALAMTASIVLSRMTAPLWGERTGGSLAGMGVLTACSVAFGVVLWFLRRHQVPLRLLWSVDLGLLWTSCALVLMVMATRRSLLHPYTAQGAGVLGLIVLMRSVVVPSTAWRTFLTGLPAPLAVLGLDLVLAAPEPLAGESGAREYLPHLIANQVVLASALGVACLSSRLHHRLLRRSWEAQRVGKYTIGERLGAGGMGEVYRATHAQLARPAAVKFLHPWALGQRSHTRFEEEARKTAMLTHPNNVTVFDFGTTASGAFYYAMELLNGADLRTLVTRTGPMPVARVLHVLLQICDALAEAHSLGLVHRDVKSANVMLCVHGGIHDFVKVLDYGLVKDSRVDLGLTSEHHHIGSLETMAPEVVGHQPVTAAVDEYAVAAVGVFLLTGEPVFNGPSAVSVMRAHLELTPEPPSRRAPEVSARFDATLLRALSKAPRDRHGGVQSLRSALASVQAELAQMGRTWSEDDARRWWVGPGAEFRAAAAPPQSD